MAVLFLFLCFLFTWLVTSIIGMFIVVQEFGQITVFEIVVMPLLVLGVGLGLLIMGISDIITWLSNLIVFRKKIMTPEREKALEGK
jgi:hypothetical protein